MGKLLLEFNFVISYQSGKKNNEADALTLKPNERFTTELYERLEHHMRVLWPPERFKPSDKLQPVEKKQ